MVGRICKLPDRVWLISLRKEALRHSFLLLSFSGFMRMQQKFTGSDVL